MFGSFYFGQTYFAGTGGGSSSNVVFASPTGLAGITIAVSDASPAQPAGATIPTAPR